MQQFIDKLIGRLEEEKSLVPYNRILDTIEEKPKEVGQIMTYQRVIEIINQLAEEYKPRTNADKVRAMNDEELAEFLEQFEACSNCEYEDGVRCTLENPCVHAFASAMIFKWLQSETKEGD
jgi:hypothetical protein